MLAVSLASHQGPQFRHQRVLPLLSLFSLFVSPCPCPCPSILPHPRRDFAVREPPGSLFECKEARVVWACCLIASSLLLHFQCHVKGHPPRHAHLLGKGRGERRRERAGLVHGMGGDEGTRRTPSYIHVGVRYTHLSTMASDRLPLLAEQLTSEFVTVKGHVAGGYCKAGQHNGQGDECPHPKLVLGNLHRCGSC